MQEMKTFLDLNNEVAPPYMVISSNGWKNMCKKNGPVGSDRDWSRRKSCTITVLSDGTKIHKESAVEAAEYIGLCYEWVLLQMKDHKNIRLDNGVMVKVEYDD